jgi:diacylglycerol O-acyltransferase
VTVGGARLTDLYSVGPILEGIGLNITVWSYLDRLNFSALACPDTLPDLPGLVRHLGPALAELVARTGASGGTSAIRDDSGVGS